MTYMHCVLLLLCFRLIYQSVLVGYLVGLLYHMEEGLLIIIMVFTWGQILVIFQQEE